MKHRLYAPNTGLDAEATLNPEYVNGVGGHTYPRLSIQVSFHIQEETGGRSCGTTQAVSFGLLTGELYVGSEKIGDARPVSIDRAGMLYRPYRDEIHSTLEFPLDFRRIECLEQKRAGRAMDAKLKVSLAVQVFGICQSQSSATAAQNGLTTVSNIQGEIPFTVPDTHWRERVLPALGYGKVIAIELPAIDLEGFNALDMSFKSLEKAQQHFRRGLYDEAVATCRVAMEPFIEHADKGDGSGKTIPRLKRSWESKVGKATYEWLDASFSAIKADANKPHHTPNSHFDRLGAQMLLMVTTALIAHAARYDRDAGP